MAPFTLKPLRCFVLLLVNEMTNYVIWTCISNLRFLYMSFELRQAMVGMSRVLIGTQQNLYWFQVCYYYLCSVCNGFLMFQDFPRHLFFFACMCYNRWQRQSCETMGFKNRKRTLFIVSTGSLLSCFLHVKSMRSG